MDNARQEEKKSSKKGRKENTVKMSSIRWKFIRAKIYVREKNGILRLMYMKTCR